MKLKKMHYVGMGFAALFGIISLFLMHSQFFFFTAGIGVLGGILPFVAYFIHETRVENEKEEMFLEFARNLVESVKTGSPISKSIVNVKNKNYGFLSEHVKKLANQISMGIPLNSALSTFAKDANNKTISRALTLIGQAERSGGEIGEILESVAEAVSTSDRLKKERKASISTLVVQGYLIFFIFIAIILITQFKIIPLMSGISGAGFGGTTGEKINAEELSGAFLYLLLIQGLFSGLAIGKLSEGSMKAGVRHSFILMFSAFIISTGANILVGG